jgi:hypothetical protein
VQKKINLQKVQIIQSFRLHLFTEKKIPSEFHFGNLIYIDESMIKLKRKSSLKQYMPLNPIKKGYKVWLLTDSMTGYL